MAHRASSVIAHAATRDEPRPSPPDWRPGQVSAAPAGLGRASSIPVCSGHRRRHQPGPAHPLTPGLQSPDR
jgi:hypothetical protein